MSLRHYYTAKEEEFEVWMLGHEERELYYQSILLFKQAVDTLNSDEKHAIEWNKYDEEITRDLPKQVGIQLRDPTEAQINKHFKAVAKFFNEVHDGDDYCNLMHIEKPTEYATQKQVYDAMVEKRRLLRHKCFN